jgi:hypothetical protein
MACWIIGKDQTNPTYTPLPFCSFKSHESATLSGHKEVVSNAWGPNIDSMLDHGERSDKPNQYLTPFLLIQISRECSFQMVVSGEGSDEPNYYTPPNPSCSFKSHEGVLLIGGESCLGPQRW